MESIARFITALCFESVGLIGVNATLNGNEKLDVVAVASFGSATAGSVDDSNKEGNSVDAGSCAAEE